MTAPNAIPNLSFWVKGDAGGPYQDSGTSTLCLSAGDLVQHWVDQSGSGNDASNATSSTRPTYQPNAADAINGIPTVRWPDKNHAYVLNIASLAPSAAAYTMFFLARGGVESGSPSGLLAPFTWTGSANSLNVEIQNGKVALFNSAGGSVNSNLYVPIRPQVWGFVSNGTTVTVYMDRAVYSATAAYSANLSAGAIGSSSVGNSKFDVAELVIYSRALTATEIAGLLTYFEGRGAIAAASTKTKLLAFDGDSLTAGSDTSQETTNIPNNYPSQLYALLDSTWEAYNLAEGGATTSTHNSANRASVIDPLLNPIQYLSSTLVVWIGTNDLQNSVSPATIWSNLQTYITAAKSAGWGRVGILTILPNVGGATVETNRQTLNASIRAGYAAAGADFVVDVGSDAQIGVAGANTNPLWYTSDNTHMTTAGYNRVAQLVSSPVIGPSSVASLLWSAYPPFQQTVKVWKGADQLLSFAPNGTQPAITGWNLQFSVRAGYGVGGILVQKSGNAVQVTSATGGLFNVTLLSADTSGLAPGNYVYDVWRTDTGASDPIAVGNLIIMPEVRL